MNGDLLPMKEHRDDWEIYYPRGENTEMNGDLLPKRREHRDEWRSTVYEGTQR